MAKLLSMARLLPRLQIAFAVIFCAVALFGPLLISQGNLVILVAALAGAWLGVITFLIGWRLEVARAPVFYPFNNWSLGILKLFLKPGEARSLKAGDRELSPAVRKALMA